MCILELAVQCLARLTSEERVMTPDSVLGWKLIPNARSFHRRDIQAYHIAVNSKGLRDREHAYDKRPAIFRIVVIGDSVVFGSGSGNVRAFYGAIRKIVQECGSDQHGGPWLWH